MHIVLILTIINVYLINSVHFTVPSERTPCPWRIPGSLSHNHKWQNLQVWVVVEISWLKQELDTQSRDTHTNCVSQTHSLGLIWWHDDAVEDPASGMLCHFWNRGLCSPVGCFMTELQSPHLRSSRKKGNCRAKTCTDLRVHLKAFPEAPGATSTFT